MRIAPYLTRQGITKVFPEFGPPKQAQLAMELVIL